MCAQKIKSSAQGQKARQSLATFHKKSQPVCHDLICALTYLCIQYIGSSCCVCAQKKSKWKGQKARQVCVPYPLVGAVMLRVCVCAQQIKTRQCTKSVYPWYSSSDAAWLRVCPEKKAWPCPKPAFHPLPAVTLGNCDSCSVKKKASQCTKPR
ncbi:hypothetical protein BC940DRAFT_312437 [Gongronella butleri]|nr:hypothetical protein BC940DRAFT_312437 [Gongronella butleri]